MELCSKRLSRTDIPPTWEDMASAVEFVGRKDVA